MFGLGRLKCVRVLMTAALVLGASVMVRPALSATVIYGTMDPTSSFGMSGTSGTLSLGTGWADFVRVEVWAFPTPFTGIPKTGNMLLRWNPAQGGLRPPALPVASIPNGNFYVTLIGYKQTSAIVDDTVGPPYIDVTCVAKRKNLDNWNSSTAEYCAFDISVFDNLAGSVRCLSGKCETSAVPAGQIVPETGWWWDPSEDGRGILIEESHGVIFLTFQLYDGSGAPVWYLATGELASDGTFYAQLNQMGGGQTLTGTYVAPRVVNSNVGIITIRFTGSTNGVMVLPDGRQISIERFRF